MQGVTKKKNSPGGFLETKVLFWQLSVYYIVNISKKWKKTLYNAILFVLLYLFLPCKNWSTSKVGN